MLTANYYDELKQELDAKGPNAAVDKLCEVLREEGDFHNLFYAMLMKRRLELGVNPIPTSPSTELPEKTHAIYEDAIREAARTVGRNFLDKGNIAHAWSYYNMIGESQPVADAIDQYAPEEEDDDCDAVVNIAFHQGINPQKGFDLILDRYGICSAITTLSGHDFGQDEAVRNYCIKRVVRTLYHELQDRLISEISATEGNAPDPDTPVRELIRGRFWLFKDDLYHIDISHLGAAVQMSVNLPPECDEFKLARELCEYGEYLSPQFQYASEPPFDEQYKDYGIYLSVLAGENVDEGLQHFRSKIEDADPDEIGTFPAEVLVNLLLRVGRDAEAMEVAGKYLVNVDERQLSCPGIIELCERTGNYDILARLAKEHKNPVHYLAGLIAAKNGGAPKN